MRTAAYFPDLMRVGSECHLALHGWPLLYPGGCRITPCPGYIESDYAPGTFYPCSDCNPTWKRVTADEMRKQIARTTPTGSQDTND